MTPLRLVAPALLLALLLPTAASAAGYGLDPAGGIDTPTRSFTWEGETFEASEVAAVDPGEEIALDVTGPGNGSARVYLYDVEKRIRATDRVEPPGRASFDTSSLSPGTYLAAVSRDGVFEAVQPVAVSGYRVAVLESPGAAERDGSIPVTLRVEPLEGAPPLHSVTVGVADAENSATAEATRTEGDTYEAELPLDGLPAGEYRVYGVALGNRTLGERHESLGLSDPAPVTVTEATGASETSGGGSSGGASFDAPDPTASAAATATRTARATDRGTEGPGDASPTEVEPAQSTRTPLQPDLEATPARTRTAPVPTGIAAVALVVAALSCRKRR